jgi:hypothetical protein
MRAASPGRHDATDFACSLTGRMIHCRLSEGVKPMIRLTTRAAAAGLALSASAAWAQQSMTQLQQQSWPSISAGQSWSASLGSSSTMRDDNSYADVYTYNAQAGETVTFTMRSADVDSWIVVDEVNGPLYEHDDDSGGGHDAQLTITFPRAGPYLVLANTVEPKAPGRYSFSVTRGGASVASNNNNSSSDSASSSDWGSLAQRLMVQMRQTFESRGYSLADFEHDGQLGASGSERVPIHLSSGTNEVVGLCDNNCSDMDLELIDASGKIVASDLEKDDFPIVDGQGGDYSLLVKMVKCNTATCSYELRVWNK